MIDDPEEIESPFDPIDGDVQQGWLEDQADTVNDGGYSDE